MSAAGDGPTGSRQAYGDDPDRTAVIPTSRGVSDQIPPGGYLDPTPGTYAEPEPGYSDPGTAYPAGGTGQPLPPPSQTDPLPGVPSSGVNRP